MNPNNFEFQKIDKSGTYGGYATYPEGIVRVSRYGLSFSRDAINRFTSTKYQNPGGAYSIRLAFEYDPRNQAIRISEDANGFAVQVFDTRGYIATFPAALKRAGAQVGDYKRVEGYDNIYQLVR